MNKCNKLNIMFNVHNFVQRIKDEDPAFLEKIITEAKHLLELDEMKGARDIIVVDFPLQRMEISYITIDGYQRVYRVKGYTHKSDKGQRRIDIVVMNRIPYTSIVISHDGVHVNRKNPLPSKESYES